MNDHSLPSKKFEPKSKDAKSKTYVICYPMAIGYSHEGLLGLVRGQFDVSETKVLNAPIKGLGMEILNC